MSGRAIISDGWSSTRTAGPVLPGPLGERDLSVFRQPEARRLFIASVDKVGYGLMQTATAPMQGRKFFYFGNAQGGQNWMDYLSNPGEGLYLEIQSGIAPTQNQRFELPPHSELEWTAAFSPGGPRCGAGP